PELGTNTKQTYSGYGYSKHLSWIRVNRTDTAREVADIIEDTIDTDIVPNTRINKNSAKIPTAIYVMASTIYWTWTPAIDLFERMRQLAGNYEWGVDELRDFYFRG
ncbi:unnamed protein product, partial [marine sediment metagenome]